MLKHAIHECDHCKQPSLANNMGLPEGWIVISSLTTIANLCSWECAAGWCSNPPTEVALPHGHAH